MPIHLVALDTDGRGWHAERDDGGKWTAFASAGGLQVTFPAYLACALTSGGEQFQVCVTTPDRFLHNIWYPYKRTWQRAWENFAAHGWPTGIDAPAPVALAEYGSRLDVFVGTRQKIPRDYPLERWERRVWYQSRREEGWTTRKAATDWYAGGVSAVAAARVMGEQHVVAFVSGYDGFHLLHTRLSAGVPLQGDGFIDGYYRGNGTLLSSQLDVAGIGIQMHLILSNGTELFHTIRLNDQAWQPSIEPIRPVVDPGFRGPLTYPAATYSLENLHVFAISEGRIVHTVRRTADPAWYNPEDPTESGFSDVLSLMPTAAGAPSPAPIARIAVAGF